MGSGHRWQQLWVRDNTDYPKIQPPLSPWGQQQYQPGYVALGCTTSSLKLQNSVFLDFA